MNAYFQLVGESGSTKLRLVPASDGGRDLDMGELIDYLNFHKIVFDVTAVNKAIASLSEETVVALNNDALTPVNEELRITIEPDKMKVIGRFYCKSDKGQAMSKDEILGDLKYKGVRYGIDEAAIDSYLANKNYHEDIVLALGTPAIQGKDASIEYFFNTDLRARPTLNEDGSVDFFNLNIINHVEEGELLARLTRETKGEPGCDVMGGKIPPRNVAKKMLKFGRNIRATEDKNEIYSECAGHVTLVDGRVFVSNVMEVENVDPATGNIEYEGNVQVNGNVCSNFSVKAKGNVEVRGVVEGATIEAGGNITIARGMNGMGKGVLKCGGNIIAKFIENSEIEAKGYVDSGSIMHSNVVAGTEVHVGGKRGFISGGKVTATTLVETKILGSDMGTDTVIEIGIGAFEKKRFKEIGEILMEDEKLLQRAVPIMEAFRDKYEAGKELSEEQYDNVRGIFDVVREKTKEMDELTEEMIELSELIENECESKVVVSDTVYPGTKIVISDVSKFIKDKMVHCKFMKSQGDVKMFGL